MKLADDLFVLGIRHHGPGSSRALTHTLNQLNPDLILIEGPSDASHLIPWLAKDAEPPLALIVYRPDKLAAQTPEQQSMYFPFAIFSPEYQAMTFGLKQDIPTRFFDLPQGHMLAHGRPLMPEGAIFQQLAEAAGHQHYESWWNQRLEQRFELEGFFEGVFEMMAAIRQESAKHPPQFKPQPKPNSPHDPAEIAKAKAAFEVGLQVAEVREAYMRSQIAEARSQGFKRIAIICGAYHSPALLKVYDEADQQLLSGLKKVEVDFAWVPWSYSRLASLSGYGAGILSPGWYHHLWESSQKGLSLREQSITWLSKTASLLRQEGFDSSPAHVLEATRLAEALASLRGLNSAGLAELSEVTQSVMCFGDTKALSLIQKKLIVGERMGQVPPDAPMVPLQRDLLAEQRRLKLYAAIETSHLKLDLRQDLHLERSNLLHRLNLLGIPWGSTVAAKHKSGNFKEIWRLSWQPEYR
ncbi:MAG: DUF5682 family protein [Deinococcales bacterium]